MTRPPAALPIEAHEAPLAPMARLPRRLWLWSAVHSQGRLAPRIASIERLRGALIAGRVPATIDWPAPPLNNEVAAAFSRLDLYRYCAGRDALTDTVLSSLCFHLDLLVDYIDRGDTPSAAATRALESFEAEWQDRCGEIDELTAVFGDFDEKNARWDLLHGMLRSAGWQDIVRIRRLLESLSALSAIIRRLGRATEVDVADAIDSADPSTRERVLAPRWRQRAVLVPDVPGETRGIRRSGRVARMLAAEATLLLHPRLRLVWHARHAEQCLLGYEDDDQVPEPVREFVPEWREGVRRVADRRLEMGPILVCVDTSGSMRGGAEQVAKAVVLEAVRTAHQQRRACHLFAFSGPGEVLESELGVDADGIERLANFMSEGFQGGTDISGPLELALNKLAEETWRNADLLIASDGEFGATPQALEQLTLSRQRFALRVQGVLIGDRETPGFREIADEIYWVKDWRRFGAGQSTASSPPADTLISRYFPAARHPHTKETR